MASGKWGTKVVILWKVVQDRILSTTMFATGSDKHHSVDISKTQVPYLTNKGDFVNIFIERTINCQQFLFKLK